MATAFAKQVVRPAAVSYEAALALALAALLAALAFVATGFFLPANLALLARSSSVLLILSLGMLLVILTGGIDVSVGSMLAVASVVVARMGNAHIAPLLSVVATVGIGALMGMINALFIAEFAVPPIVTTLATLGIYRGLLLQWTGGEWVTSLPPWIAVAGSRRFMGLDAATVCAIVLTVVFWRLLAASNPGRNLYRYGGSPASARRAGISERSVIYSAYIAMGLLTGVAAIFYAAQLGSVQGNAAVGYELTVIAAVVLGGASIAGGRGSVLGTVLGVLLLGIIQSALILLHIPVFWQGVATGTMVLAGVAAGALRNRTGRSTWRLIGRSAEENAA